jgi:murein DD-endopeptidase MepM/ murein hydrolase activator NlpD
VVIRHASGLETFYAHLSKRNVNTGDWVSAGDIIGLGGSTGRSTGPHLHFETRYRGAAFDPSWLIDFETGTLRHRLLKVRSWYFNPNQRYVQNVDDEDEIFRTDEEDRILAEKKPRKRLQPVPVQRLLRRNTTPSAAATPCPASPRSIIPR